LLDENDLKNLSVGISTIFPNLDRAKILASEIIAQASDDLLCEVVIVCQKSPSAFVDRTAARLKIVAVTDSGLSKSRNLVLQSASGDFVWFLDDDVTVNRDVLDVIARTETTADVISGRIGCSNSQGYYKNYTRKAVAPFSLLRLSSIELIVRRKKVFEKGVRFDERLGLGAQYPCGEENAFLLDLYRRGAKFQHLNEVIVFHPCGNDGDRDYFRTPPQMFARGIVARKFGLFFGFFLCFRWALRALKRPSSLRLVISIFRGYWHG